jgi:hypothetical protein
VVASVVTHGHAVPAVVSIVHGQSGDWNVDGLAT